METACIGWLSAVGSSGPWVMCTLLKAGLSMSLSYKGVLLRHKHTLLLLRLLIIVY